MAQNHQWNGEWTHFASCWRVSESEAFIALPKESQKTTTTPDHWPHLSQRLKVEFVRERQREQTHHNTVNTMPLIA